MDTYNCLLVLFDSTNQALAGEKALKEAGIRHAVVNTPREFSVSCGISLRIEPGSRDAAESALKDKGVAYAGMSPYRSRWVQ